MASKQLLRVGDDIGDFLASLVSSKDRWGCLEEDLALAAVEGRTEDVERLLQRGARPHARNAQGHTCLMHAAINGHNAVAKLLVETCGESLITARRPNGWNAIMYAARFGHADVVRTLGGGAEWGLGDKDEDGMTALMWGCRGGHKDVVEALTSMGGEGLVGARSWDGSTALHHACDAGQLPAVIQLVDGPGGGVPWSLPRTRPGQTASPSRPRLATPRWSGSCCSAGPRRTGPWRWWRGSRSWLRRPPARTGSG